MSRTPRRDWLGNPFREFRTTSDGLAIAAYGAEGPLEFWYAARGDPRSPGDLLAVVIPSDGGWLVLGALGRSASPQAVWESVFALRQLMQGQGEGAAR